MKRTLILPLTGAGALLAAGGMVASCSSDDTSNPETTDAGADTGVVDSSISDSGIDAADAGPICTVTPCAVQITAGGAHHCARFVDNSVKCWGENLYGEIGSGGLADGGFDPSSQPTPAAVGGLTNAMDISGGGEGDLAFTNQDFTCAVVAGGAVQCWGNNFYGQLGRGSDAGEGANDPHPTPAPVVGLSGIGQVSAGHWHACALSGDGGVLCWGNNQSGPIAPGDLTGATAFLTPTAANRDSGVAEYIRGEKRVTCALFSNQTVECVGRDNVGQLGRDGGTLVSNGTPDWGAIEPGDQSGPYTDVTQVAGGLGHTCVLRSNGNVHCWGYNFSGQLGDGTEVDRVGAIQVTLPRPARLIGAGHYNSYAVLDDDSVWCWGENGFGQCGNGNTDGGSFDSSDVQTPHQIDGFSGKVLQIVAGRHSACALIEGGGIQCFGSNFYGQLGQGLQSDGAPATDPAEHPAPVTVQF